MIDRVVATEAAMIALGQECGATLPGPSILALCGDLGAGKTQFVKGLARGLGYDGEVASPTFPLLHEYHSGRHPLFHFDFYRLESEDDLRALDFEEMLGSGVVAVEWADRFPDWLPPETRWLHFTILDRDERRVKEGAHE